VCSSSIKFWPRVSIEAIDAAFTHTLGVEGICTEFVEARIVGDDSCYFRKESRNAVQLQAIGQ